MVRDVKCAVYLRTHRSNLRAIEDNVLKTCPEIVRYCVAVGHLKPRVILFIESNSSSFGQDEAAKLKQDVLKRTADYNSRLLEHERITDPSSILVVPAGSLPRTSVSPRYISYRYWFL